LQLKKGRDQATYVKGWTMRLHSIYRAHTGEEKIRFFPCAENDIIIIDRCVKAIRHATGCICNQLCQYQRKLNRARLLRPSGCGGLELENILSSLGSVSCEEGFEKGPSSAIAPIRLFSRNGFFLLRQNLLRTRDVYDRRLFFSPPTARVLVFDSSKVCRLLVIGVSSRLSNFGAEHLEMQVQ
jgi:hypothetical protein